MTNRAILVVVVLLVVYSLSDCHLKIILKAIFDCFLAAEMILFELFSRKEVLGVLVFDIPTAVKGTVGGLTRIG